MTRVSILLQTDDVPIDDIELLYDSVRSTIYRDGMLSITYRDSNNEDAIDSFPLARIFRVTQDRLT